MASARHRHTLRRNAAAIAADRVELLLGSAEQLPHLPIQFDKIFAINVFMFWRDPGTCSAVSARS